MGKLVLHLPDGSTRDIVLARERMTIGRHADNDVCLPLPAVSAQHAAIVTVHDDSFLEDLGSRNGTRVNGKRVTKHLLRDHDEIDIGRQRLVYFSGAFAATTKPRRAKAQELPPTTTPAPERAERTAAEPVPAPQSRALVDTTALFAPRDADEKPAPMADDALVLEVLDGPLAGTCVPIDREDFVLGRLGVQLATIRRTDDGPRLAALEGESPPMINGAPLPAEGMLLGRDDEIAIAGVRLRYREP